MFSPFARAIFWPMNRVDCLMSIVVHLQGCRLVRAEDIAAHVEISVRTGYRDIAPLAEAGIPALAAPVQSVFDSHPARPGRATGPQSRLPGYSTWRNDPARRRTARSGLLLRQLASHRLLPAAA